MVPAYGRADSGLEVPISTALALAAVLVLVLANGFFVATEFALVAVRRTRIQHLAAEGNGRARAVLSRLNHLDSYIAATQLGITISSLALGWIGEPALAHLIEPAIEQLPGISDGNRDTLTHTIGFILAFSIITTLHIVLGELAPKSMALQRPEATSLWAAGPIHVFYVAFRPIISVLNSVGNAVVRLLGIEPAAGHERVQSAQELMLAVDASREAGLVDQASHDIVDRAFAFANLDIRHVMVPRTEMVAVPVEARLPDVLRLAASTGYTRLPVYEGDTDHLVGILDIRHLLPLLAEQMGDDEPTASSEIAPYLRPPFLVPESAPAADVLERMRHERVQLAVVVDEYGGTAGIVSLEDLVEALVGEIRDERDPASPDEVFPDGSLFLDGLTPLVELRERHGLDVMEDGIDVETLGGYVFARLGRVAEVGDEVTSRRHLFRVEEVDGLRVARVRIEPLEEPTHDE
ncbi:MAG: magnesium and cobalt exporter, family [Thermomicrobiales bacterium]|nr:magnesium and cobalt exporter, family [Thermomicrobiales bacterium]